MDTVAHQYFSRDYQSARSRFLAAATNSGGILKSVLNPLSGPNEEVLATDALFLQSNKDNLLVMTSGTHGVELLCGSGCQAGHLELGRFESILEQCSVLLLHALNPWGAAYRRRNTEENVDLCRNFVDFSIPLPENPEYDALHKSICNCNIEEIPHLIAECLAKYGTRTFMNAIMSGQYKHAAGFSFGGHAPTWANRTTSKLLTRFASDFKRVCIVDYHSGVGPYGYGSVVCMQEGAALEKVKRMFGDWVVAPREEETNGSDEFYSVFGHASDGYRSALPRVELSTVVLEFGTYSSDTVLHAMLAEHASRFGQQKDPIVIDRCATSLESMHHSTDKQWLRAVWDRADQIIDQAVAGFAL